MGAASTEEGGGSTRASRWAAQACHPPDMELDDALGCLPSWVKERTHGPDSPLRVGARQGRVSAAIASGRSETLRITRTGLLRLAPPLGPITTVMSWICANAAA